MQPLQAVALGSRGRANSWQRGGLPRVFASTPGTHVRTVIRSVTRLLLCLSLVVHCAAVADVTAISAEAVLAEAIAGARSAAPAVASVVVPALGAAVVCVAIAFAVGAVGVVVVILF